MTDVDGEAVVGEEVCSDDRHEDVCYREFPWEPLGTVGEGHLFKSVSADEGAVSSIHLECGFLSMTRYNISGEQ